jgi:DNA-binding CsgD family transcriptional regulator
MKMNFTQLSHFFSSAKSPEELKTRLIETLQPFKISAYAFTYYAHHPLASNRIRYDFCAKKFDRWHQHYLEENYERCDNFLETAYHATTPIFWTVDQQIKEAKTEREKQMRLDAKAFGAQKGICIPLHGPDDHFACLLVVEMTGETCLTQSTELPYTLMTIAQLYFHFLREILPHKSLKHTKAQYGLTQRELHCLSLVARDLSVPKIAAIMNITERTVNYHIQKINKKLGTKNKYQSLAKALSAELIKPANDKE